ncbi:MAG: carboxypeptidase-like regulatory domain-containing protein [Flavobacteriales bacterium]|nr:carboxypeptidase-like regulatory domain-containing protein [Flavobacteriales bacterium]
MAQVTVKGVIKDDNTGETMIGAAVIIKGTSIGTVTDIDGKFEFIAPDSPPFTLVISFLGYTNQEVDIESLDQKISIALTTDEVLMDAVEVVGERISQKQKESPLTVESMDILAIKETASSDFYEGIGQLKGVDLTTASMAFKVINTRGFNSTSPVRSLQIIDGVDNQSPGLNFSLGNFLGASELDVMKLDIIQGASSAYFGPNAFNGVISMTTKNPFQFPGLSAIVKVGERGLFDAGFRYARVFKNKDDVEKFAYKVSFSFLRANDWEATNTDSTIQSEVDSNNPGGYDAVNRYGDENFGISRNNFTSKSGQVNKPGLGIWHRTGYNEADLVDYNTQNIKVNAGFHYRLEPEVELIYNVNFGNGTTVYQGDNRYSLKDILFLQNRVELRKKDKYFIRAYSTHEDAGNSYDAVFTAFLLQEAARSDNDWSKDYINFWSGLPASDPAHIPGGMVGKVKALPNFPTVGPSPDFFYDFDQANAILDANSDSLNSWHQLARSYADSRGTPRFEPGTARFDSAFKAITTDTLGKGGTRFLDESALYHVHGEYKFTPEYMDIIVGANFRSYNPVSHGSIFSDTGGVKITNWEYGVYTGLEKKFVDDKLKINLTSRLDKNENFDFLLSPAASIVYSHNPAQIFRFSFSSAIRNPTLADQFLFYNVGRAILLGNINGRDSLVTTESLLNYFSATTLNADSLVYFNVDPIRPEKVKTFEVGYRATFWGSLYMDANYYYSIYKDFIGFKIGAEVDFDPVLSNQITALQAFRVASNADSTVTTQGVSVGLNYFFKKHIALSGNYSWNKLKKTGTDDPIIPAFNTPEHKFNLGISGRDIKSKIGDVRITRWGFSVNYKWIQGFTFEGSPQFTGDVPTYDLLDFQINKFFPKLNMTAKLGASNTLNKKRFQVYGGPLIGRLGYFSLLFELDKI